MKAFLIASIVIFAVFLQQGTAYNLTCYSCGSASECSNGNYQTTEGPYGYCYACYTIRAAADDTVYVKDCAAVQCENLNAGMAPFIGDNRFECCEQSLCNGGSNLAPTALVSLVVIWRFR